MKNRKKAYTFRLSQHTSNNLSKLASAYGMDRTAVLEYIIGIYSAMWVEGTEPDFMVKDEEKVLDS